LEEGRLQERRQDQTKKLDDENNYCNRYHLHLTLLLGWFLFCGCCFYIAYQNIRFEETENQISNIIRGALRELMYESQTEMQNSQNAKMSVIFIKPEVVINKMNGHLEETDLIEEQDTKQQAAVRNEHSMNAASSINESDNVVSTSDIDNLSITPLPEDLRDDGELRKPSTWRINADKYDDITVNVNTAESLFLEKLYNIARTIPDVKMIDDEETENRNTLTEDNNHLTVNNFENAAPNVNALNKLKSSGSDVTMISNHNDLPDRKVMSSNNLRDTKFSDSIEDTLHDRSNSGFSSDATTKRNLLDLSTFDSFSLREYLESSESSDDSWIPRSALMQETFEQIENKSSHDTDAANKDGHHVDANDLLTSSPDSSIPENKASLFPFSVPMVSVENAENQYPLKIGPRNTKEDERSKPIEDIKDSFEFWVGSPTIQEEYPWIKSDSNYPFLESHYHTQKPVSKPKDLKPNKILNPFLSSNEDTTIEDVIPKSRCKFEVTSGIVTVRCPAIKFNEEWNLTSTENHTTAPQDVSRDNDSYENLYDDYYIECDEGTANQPKDVLISKENPDIKKTATSQYNAATAITEFEKSPPNNKKISNDALLESPKAMEIDSLANTRGNQDTIYNENEKKPVTTVSILTSDFDTDKLDKRWNLKTADVQQKSIEKQKSGDFIDSSNTPRKDRSLEIVETDDPFERRLIAILMNEITVLRERQRKAMESNAKHVSSEEYLDICNNYPLICDPSLIDILAKTHLEKASTYPHDSALAFRKKRMTDDLTQPRGIIAYKNFILELLKKRI